MCKILHISVYLCKNRGLFGCFSVLLCSAKTNYKMNKIFLTALVALFSSSALAQRVITVSVANPSAADRADQPVLVSLGDYGYVSRAIVTCDGSEIPCQLDDLNQDDTFDELCFLADLKGKQRKQYQVTLYSDTKLEPAQYPARVFAELLLRNDKVKEKNRHNNYIQSITARGDCADSYHAVHHHGVCFESELNGIRIYFDKRQTLDLYGKFQKRLELEATQFYTSPEQKAEGYGDDVLWVGNTFGLGAFRGWDGSQPTMIEPVKSRTQRIISYGPLRTIVEVEDKGWQGLNITLRYIQYAGHRDTDVEVYFTKPYVNMRDYQFSTGLVNLKESQEYSDHRGLRGSWGQAIGLGILIPKQYIISEQPANADTYAFVIGTDSNTLKYKVTYSSDNETFGYHSANDWFSHLEQWRKEVEQPVKVTVAKR